MAYRTVISIDTDCYKCKKVALHSITKIDGINTVSINTKERTITVDGDADPVCIVNKIKSKIKCARLVSTGPPPSSQKTEEEKKKEEEEKKKKEEEEKKKKKEKKKKEEEEKKKKEEEEKKKKKEKEKKDDGKCKIIMCPKYPPCTGYCSCTPPQHCGCSTCSSKSGIIPWPGYHPPKPPANEVWYFWNDENPRSCTIC